GTLIAGLVWVGGRVSTSHAARRTSLESGRERRALDAVWDALFADLRVAAVVVALAGLLLAAVAAGLGSWTADLSRARERLGAVRIPPAVRSAGLLALGAACLLAPGLLARAVVVLL